ncbi:hypothetical protein A1O3_10095 [Capronia epimyces CBS 606.96]|uniref:Methyltransferase n=1 Tax=Capronia epimyces CBS 606.96 TaxID=1182542 RepID=W9X9Q5_9EURO|nr:uncharacterized protein A1O3_10095 [Capronia epimyces CBS 606.96]EXJ76938.1 hypothetical protein A1O3_10095 [Capronia epimyces CBS 606.96]
MASLANPDVEGEVEVEVDHSDARSSASDSDSAYSDTVCSTESLRSSIFDHEIKHGRTFHAFHSGKYVMPNDEGEQERMDLHYHAMRLAIEDKITHAPITNPHGILDLGTGTGIWAMDAADAYPEAEVVGIDLSPIQPGWVPPNLQFEVADADEAWGFGEDRFDLVHTRIMNGFGVSSWPHFYREAFSCLRPGGWVENQEFDCQIVSDDASLPEDSTMAEWAKLWNQACEMIGKTGRCDPQKLRDQMHEAGFINTRVIPYKMPIGPWPKDPMLKEAGKFGLVALHAGVYGMSVRLFLDVLGWSEERLQVFLADFRKDLARKSIHAYWPTYIVIGQKPPLPAE